MKKILALVLAALMLLTTTLTFASCGTPVGAESITEFQGDTIDGITIPSMYSYKLLEDNKAQLFIRTTYQTSGMYEVFQVLESTTGENIEYYKKVFDEGKLSKGIMLEYSITVDKEKLSEVKIIGLNNAEFLSFAYNVSDDVIVNEAFAETYDSVEAFEMLAYGISRQEIWFSPIKIDRSFYESIGANLSEVNVIEQFEFWDCPMTLIRTWVV